MKKLSIRKLAEEALVLLANTETSPKELYNYRVTGFGAIVRHFEKHRIAKFSDIEVDQFIIQSRIDFENHKISEWKWRNIRKGGEILKTFYETGSVEIPILPSWKALHDPIKKPPTKEQLRDKENIFAIVWKVKQEIQKFGWSRRTVYHYTCDGFNVVLREHIKFQHSHYSQKVIDSLMAESRTRYDAGKLCRSTYQNLFKVCDLIQEYRQTGTVTHHNRKAWNQREPSPEFVEALDCFHKEAILSGNLSDKTIEIVKSSARGFFFELEDQGITSFETTTLEIVSQVTSKRAEHYAGGLSAFLFSLRTFLSILFKQKVTALDFSIAIPEFSAPRKVVRPGFTKEEIELLLEMPDLSTDIGNRDFAILTLAAQSGLRGSDIANLKIDAINWRTNEIQLIQKKTGKTLSIPLEAESGNAIANYLLNYRPKCDLPFLFLCLDHPYRPFAQRTIGSRVTRYMKQAGIDKSKTPRRGLHSFRRSFGARLLDAEVPIDIIQQLLGHTHIDSIKPYLSVNEKGLKACALSTIPVDTEAEL